MCVPGECSRAYVDTCSGRQLAEGKSSSAEKPQYQMPTKCLAVCGHYLFI